MIINWESAMIFNNLPADFLLYIAVNAGLLILAAWFYILLLILREFRLFAQTVVKGNHSVDEKQNQILQYCADAIDKSTKFVEDNQATIQELANVQVHLEQQLADVKASTGTRVSASERKKIDELNSKLLKSHKLVKKLKGDLDRSVAQLEDTKQKLFAQYQSTEQLQKENSSLKQKLDGFEKAGSSSDAEIVKLMENFAREKQNMSDMISDYKKQIAEQSQALEQLSLQEKSTEDGPKLQAVKEELEQTREALKNLSKEKKFIESRYLEIINKHEPKPSDNSD